MAAGPAPSSSPMSWANRSAGPSGPRRRTARDKSSSASGRARAPSGRRPSPNRHRDNREARTRPLARSHRRRSWRDHRHQLSKRHRRAPRRVRSPPANDHASTWRVVTGNEGSLQLDQRHFPSAHLARRHLVVARSEPLKRGARAFWLVFAYPVRSTPAPVGVLVE